jgi:hypothetical protein
MMVCALTAALGLGVTLRRPVYAIAAATVYDGRDHGGAAFRALRRGQAAGPVTWAMLEHGRQHRSGGERAVTVHLNRTIVWTASSPSARALTR